MPLPHTEFMKLRLQAPLKNPEWSYGSIDIEGSVILKIWSNEIINYPDGSRFAKVMWPNVNLNRPGMKERNHHINLIKQGSSGYGFICSQEILNSKLRVKSYIDEYLIELINVFKEDEGFVLVKLGNRKSIY